MKNTFIIIVVLIIAVIVGSYTYTNQTTTTVPSSQTQEGTSISQVPTDVVEEAGGNFYQDANDIFSIVYPTDYTQDMEGETITRIYKRGASQREQTEMTDGVIVTIQTEPLNGQTLEERVDTVIKQSIDSGMVEVTSPKTAVTVNGQGGFTYKIRGLGESTYIILHKNENPQHAVTIVYAVLGTDTEVYQQEVDTMLSTLQILE